MVSVSEATTIIQKHLYRPSREMVKIENAEGRILAEAIKADRDFPPFDRVAMDGIALAHKSYAAGWTDLKVESMQPAGQPRLTLKDDKNCIEVMTGAMLPIGCDTVVPYEDVMILNGIARIKAPSVSLGQCIHPRAQDANRHDELLTQGARISASEIAVLATVGRLEAEVFAFPKTAIISSGNELVDIHDRPLPHQIRRSNSYALRAALTSIGCPSSLFHVPDDRNAIERELGKILSSHELVILTGGVSKGKFDHVPASLITLGVEQLFHQVSQRPGKPLWFGSSKKNIVFALPGNPVSTFLCFYRYIKPWLMTSIGAQQPARSAVLSRDFTFNGKLTYFLQVKTRSESGKLLADPVPGGGSGDFANLKEVDGFLELPAEPEEFKAGESFPYIPFRER